MLKKKRWYLSTYPLGESGITVEQVKGFITSNKDNVDIQKFVKELNPINDDVVKNYLTSDENGKRLSNSLFDSRVSLAAKKANENYIEKFKVEELPKLIDAKVKELYPEETPEQKAVREQKLRIDKLEAENQLKDLTNGALSYITDKKLPFASFIDRLIGENSEETIKNIDKLAGLFNSEVEKAVKERLGKDGREPGGGDDKPIDIDAQIEKAEKEGNNREVIRLRNIKYFKNKKE